MFDPTYKKTKCIEFQFTPIKRQDLLKLVSDSSCLVDVQHSKQTGLTMRTVEALGACRKLITTNESIKEYDFYNPNNILIVDRKKPDVKTDFWNTPYQKLEDNIYNRYSLETWVADVIE